MTMKKLVVRIALCAAAALCTSRSMSADLPWMFDKSSHVDAAPVAADSSTGHSLYAKTCSVVLTALDGLIDGRIASVCKIAGFDLNTQKIAGLILIFR